MLDSDTHTSPWVLSQAHFRGKQMSVLLVGVQSSCLGLAPSNCPCAFFAL